MNHFKKEKWQEIDNTLIPITDASGSTYLITHVNPNFSVEYHPTSDAATILLQNEHGNMLGWRLKNAQNSTPIPVRKILRKRFSHSQYVDLPHPFRSEVIYKSILPGADLRCSIPTIPLKNTIVFENRAAICLITCILITPDVTPLRNTNGVIDLITCTGDIAYTILQPYMQDSNSLNHLDWIACELQQTQERDIWQLTFSPNDSWLDNAQFPVTINTCCI